jgi:hypothetical protein
MAIATITRRQREVLDHLSEKSAFSRESAANTATGLDENVADTLAQRGVINKRYDTTRGAVYWIRGDDEPATTASVPAGFVVILTRNVTTPSGRPENFFLARAPYDGKGTTFRRLLRGWMRRLNLRAKDLISGSWAVEQIAADAAVFGGDHVIVDEEGLE